MWIGHFHSAVLYFVVGPICAFINYHTCWRGQCSASVAEQGASFGDLSVGWFFRLPPTAVLPPPPHPTPTLAPAFSSPLLLHPRGQEWRSLTQKPAFSWKVRQPVCHTNGMSSVLWVRVSAHQAEALGILFCRGRGCSAGLPHCCWLLRQPCVHIPGRATPSWPGFCKQCTCYWMLEKGRHARRKGSAGRTVGRFSFRLEQALSGFPF